MTESQRTDRGRRTVRDKFIEDFPWFGGPPGRHARAFVAVWVTVLSLLAVAIIVAFVTLHICLAVGLIILTAVVATLPSLFLIGSRI